MLPHVLSLRAMGVAADVAVIWLGPVHIDGEGRR